MFKSIKGTLDRRQQTVGREVNIADITQQALLAFLQQTYSDTSARISVRYQESDHTVVIATAHKTLANELLLHTPELKVYLVSRGIRVNRVIVR